jgi:hypothetical protein
MKRDNAVEFAIPQEEDVNSIIEQNLIYHAETISVRGEY